jgi:hypothetical protein
MGERPDLGGRGLEQFLPSEQGLVENALLGVALRGGRQVERASRVLQGAGVPHQVLGQRLQRQVVRRCGRAVLASHGDHLGLRGVRQAPAVWTRLLIVLVLSWAIQLLIVLYT